MASPTAFCNDCMTMYRTLPPKEHTLCYKPWADCDRSACLACGHHHDPKDEQCRHGCSCPVHIEPDLTPAPAMKAKKPRKKKQS